MIATQDPEWCMAKSVCEEVLVKCRASYGLNPPTIKNIKHFEGDYFSCFFLMHVFLIVAILFFAIFPVSLHSAAKCWLEN